MPAINGSINGAVPAESYASCSKYLKEKSAVVVIALAALGILVLAIIKRDTIAKFVKSNPANSTDSLPSSSSETPSESDNTHKCINSKVQSIHVKFVEKPGVSVPCDTSEVFFRTLAGELQCNISEVAVCYGIHTIKFDPDQANVCFQKLFKDTVGLEVNTLNSPTAIVDNSIYGLE